MRLPSGQETLLGSDQHVIRWYVGSDMRGGSDCAWEPPVSYGDFWKNFLFNVACLVALFALGNLDFAFTLVSFSIDSGRVRCMVQQALDGCQHFPR